VFAGLFDLTRWCVSWEYRRLLRVRGQRQWRNEMRARRNSRARGETVALVTVIGPGSAVVVEGFNLPGATVERVEMREGASPLVYAVRWRESPTGPVRRATFRADQVTEPEPTEAPVVPGSNKLADLGRQLQQQLTTPPRG
jgi:hypothetical protein